MPAFVQAIFIADSAGAPVRQIESVRALCGVGLEGDRYAARTGRWSSDDVCQTSFIEADALEAAARDYGVCVANGEHRRNIVVRGLRLEALRGRRFRIGDALFAYEKPRPPCGYLAELTERMMTKSLWQRAGICASVVTTGLVRAGDSIVIVEDGASEAAAARNIGTRPG